MCMSKAGLAVDVKLHLSYKIVLLYNIVRNHIVAECWKTTISDNATTLCMCVLQDSTLQTEQ